MVWCLTGFMGCGKSSVGRIVAHRLDVPFIDLDEAVEKMEGRSIPEMFNEGESVFREAELKALRSILDSAPDSGLVLALGGGTIMTPEARELILSRTLCIYMKAEAATLRENIGDMVKGRPLLKDNNLEELLARRLPVYSQAHLMLVTDGKDVETMADEICQMISSRS